MFNNLTKSVQIKYQKNDRAGFTIDECCEPVKNGQKPEIRSKARPIITPEANYARSI